MAGKLDFNENQIRLGLGFILNLTIDVRRSVFGKCQKQAGAKLGQA